MGTNRADKNELILIGLVALVNKCFELAWVALGKFLGEFVYLAVEICHRWTLLSATPSFQVRKNFENRQKHQRRRSAWVGQADFGKLELNNRNHSGNSQRLVMNVIHLKHDQFKINAVEFSDLREEASTRLSFAMASFFSKTLYRQGLHSLINLRYLKVFTGTSSIEGEPVPFTGLLFSKLNALFASKHFLVFFICPILLKLGMEEKDPSTKVRTKKRKMFSGIWRS